MKRNIIFILIFFMFTTLFADTGRYIIFGSVKNTSGKGLPQLHVHAYDKDSGGDDLLAITTTDRDGNFRIYFQEKHFKDEANEKSPDIYLIVKNRAGKILGRSNNLSQGRETINGIKFISRIVISTKRKHRLNFKQKGKFRNRFKKTIQP